MNTWKNDKISSIQLGLMISAFLYGSTIVVNPAGKAETDAWIAVLITIPFSLILINMYSSISVKNTSKPLQQILTDYFGKYLGNFLSLLYAWYFIHLSSLIMRNFGEFIDTITYPETPISVIIVSNAIVTIYLVKSGIETIGRTCELLVPILIFTIVAVSFSLITSHDIKNLLPIFSKGIGPILAASFSLLSFPFGETVVFLTIFPFHNSPNSTKKVSFIATLVLGLILLYSIMRNLMILGGGLLYNINFPTHLIAQLVPGISLEPLADLNLFIGGGIKVAVCIFGASTLIVQVFNVDSKSSIITAVSVFTVVLSIWIYSNIFQMFKWAASYWPYYSIIFQIIIPLALYILTKIKTKKNTEAMG